MGVEPEHNLIQIDLGVRRQVRPLRKVLPKQAVGILVRASLPRTLRVTEVDLDIRGHGEGFVRRYLAAPIIYRVASTT